MRPQSMDVEERTISVESRDEKPGVGDVEDINKSAHAIAERGYEATDR